MGIACSHLRALVPQKLLHNTLRHVVVDHPRADGVAETVRLHTEQRTTRIAYAIAVGKLIDRMRTGP